MVKYLSEYYFLWCPIYDNAPSSIPWIYGFKKISSWPTPEYFKAAFSNSGGNIMGLIVGKPLLVFAGDAGKWNLLGNREYAVWHDTITFVIL